MMDADDAAHCSSITRSVLAEKCIENGSRKQLLDLNYQHAIVEKLHVKLEMERKERAEIDALVRRQEETISQQESELQKTSAELKHARSVITNQIAEGDALNADLRDLEHKMQLVRDIVQVEMEKFDQDHRDCLAFLNDRTALTRKHSKRLRPAASPSPSRASTPKSDSADYTEGSMDLIEERTSNAYHRRDVNVAPKRKRSRSVHNLTNFSSKRSRSKAFDPMLDDECLVPRKRSNLEILTDASIPSVSAKPSPIESNINYNLAATPQVPAKSAMRVLNRSLSADDLLRDTVATRMTGSTNTASSIDSRRVHALSWTKGLPIESRHHTFQKLTGFLKVNEFLASETSSQLVNCDACGQSVSFISRLSACSDCHAVCLIPILPLPCIPRSSKIPKRRDGMRLTDFCPKSPPMIPYPVIQMIVALEKKDLDVDGIYRRDQLLASFKAAKNPRLDRFDPEVIADTLKMFLREFKDPVIPRSSRDEFVNAVQKGSRDALNAAIYDLPHPHCDTLAYLCLHWIRVTEHSTSNRMSVENIARCVARSVIGQSTTHADVLRDVPETRKNEAVMVALLKKPEHEWRELLGMAMQGYRDRTPVRSVSVRTPGNRTAVKSPSHDSSLLGPITPGEPIQQMRSRPVRLFDDIR